MKSDFKVLLIFPPVASPVSPYLSLPLLAGQIKRSGFSATCCDLSLDFFDYILNKEFVSNSYEKAKQMLSSLIELSQNKTLNDSEFKNYSLDLKKTIFKKEKIQKALLNEDNNLNVINSIDDAISCYKSEHKFYNPNEMEKAYDCVQKAFDLLMLPYSPALLSFHYYKNPLYKITFNALKHQVADCENTIFYDFYKQKIAEYKIQDYDMVCISCPNETQILPSMMLAKLIKENFYGKIVLGGNIISRIDNELCSMSELFDEFFDYMIIGCGENSLVELANSIFNNNEKYKLVKGLLYKKDGKVFSNKPDLKYDINKSAPILLEGLKLGKYYSPDIIMPIQSSKGCYWGKCTFCGLHYPPKKYTVKNPKKLVDELELLHKNYGIKYFEFIDEAIHPKYLEKIADIIIDRNLEINYVCCARMEEKLYTKKLCEKLYKSGLRLVEFGYESASKKVYDSLNKGIKFDNRMSVVKELASAGIFTYLYAIIGYPNETKEEAEKTIKILDEYPEIVDFLFIHKFWLDKKSPALKKYKKIGISQINENTSNILQQKIDFIVENENYKKDLDEAYGNYYKRNFKYSFFAPDEYFFLYVLHQGRNYTKKLLN